MTPKAVAAVRRFIKFSATPVAALRVFVTDGGCSGLQYGVKLEAAAAAEDAALEVDGVTLLLDPQSRPLLDGLTIDFVDSITESGFKFDNPNAKAACGCGKSFTL
jgi:iron-sulfur cluster assembly protein